MSEEKRKYDKIELGVVDTTDWPDPRKDINENPLKGLSGADGGLFEETTKQPEHQLLEIAANGGGTKAGFAPPDHVAEIKMSVEGLRYGGVGGLGQALRQLAKVIAGPKAWLHVHKHADQLAVKIYTEEQAGES